VADSKKEERATSSLLATFMAVPIFAKEILAEAGAPVGKRVKFNCYTEVSFKTDGKSKQSRPDGLIVVSGGTKQWTALVESKVGSNELTPDQVETYLRLSKQLGFDALITISNQFATVPIHHPLNVSKSLLKSVKLYHFSWLSLKSKAVLLTGNKQIEDTEQAFILSELVRYLDHPSSGVSELNRMPTEWKDLCDAIQQGAVLSKSSSVVEQSVSGWQQLLRYLALNLSMSIAEPVKLALSRARERSSEANFQEGCIELSKEHVLPADFEIPNAAAKLHLSADVLRRTINISMKLEAPKDKYRATASINWLTRQLKQVSPESVSIRAYWPKRIAMTTSTLADALADPRCLIPGSIKDLPTYLEVIRVVDLAGSV
jgi:hypothetical protein